MEAGQMSRGVQEVALFLEAAEKDLSLMQTQLVVRVKHMAVAVVVLVNKQVVQRSAALVALVL
jgi:hypothetical protein